MLITIFQAFFKFALKSIVIFGLAFMIICTVFVIVSIAHRDIKINIIRDEDENKQK